MKLDFKHIKADALSGLVVFLIALPLCLGIALASGAPLFAGVISGIIGGIVVGSLSSSHISVTGPAAGLTAIVLAAISGLGSYENFLVAVVIAGLIQIIMGFVKAGNLSNYIPTNVIEGMLAAIGIIIILKQIPHAVGYDVDNEGEFFWLDNVTGVNFFTRIIETINFSHPGALLITIISLMILLAWQKVSFLKTIKTVPAALVVVMLGVVMNELLISGQTGWAISQEHLVNLPSSDTFSVAAFLSQFTNPDFAAISNLNVWITGVTIAIVASIETLLCIEAADKMDPYKRVTDANTELKAQGVGNMLSGLIGGLPVTSVIVRTSANLNSGARTKLSAIFHGMFLLIAVMTIPFLLNKIPLASLAAILIMIGYKLASPAVFKHMWQCGKLQFIPFLVTVIAVVFTDLLKGVGIGLATSAVFVLYNTMKVAYSHKEEEHNEGNTIYIRLAQEVSFLNKAAIKKTLSHLPEGSQVVIDAQASIYIDHDVVALIREFIVTGSGQKNIRVKTTGFGQQYKIENSI